MKPKLRALLALSGGPLGCSPVPVSLTESETSVASESAMDGLSESPRSNSGVSTLSTVTLISGPETPLSTDFGDGREAGGGGAHSNSR